MEKRGPFRKEVLENLATFIKTCEDPDVSFMPNGRGRYYSIRQIASQVKRRTDFGRKAYRTWERMYDAQT